jgi:hypothetical protein
MRGLNQRGVIRRDESIEHLRRDDAGAAVAAAQFDEIVFGAREKLPSAAQLG